MGMEAQYARMGIHVAEKLSCPPRVFGRNQNGVSKHNRQSLRDISQITQRACGNVERAQIIRPLRSAGGGPSIQTAAARGDKPPRAAAY
jgi:hypothetical protein